MNETVKIEVTEKGSPAFYREAVNATMQYGRLMGKPEAKLADRFKEFKIYLIVSAVLLPLLLVKVLLWGGDAFQWTLVLLLAVILVLSIYLLHVYNKQVDAMMKDEGAAQLILNGDGIELIKASVTVKLAWDNIAFARVFRESVCFFAKRQTGLVVAVDRRHYAQIRGYIKARIVESGN